MHSEGEVQPMTRGTTIVGDHLGGEFGAQKLANCYTGSRAKDILEKYPFLLCDIVHCSIIKHYY